MAFITNYIQNTAMNMLGTGITYAGTMAGNAVGGVGTMIENGGRSIGDTAEGFVSKGGNWVNGYGDKIMSATATQDGIKRAPPKAGGAAKGITNGAKGGASAYTKKAIPANASKVKGLPAPAPSAAKNAPTSYSPQFSSVAAAKPKVPTTSSAKDTAGKVRVSAASKPKLPGGLSSAVPSGPKPPTAVNVPTPPGPKPPTVVNTPKAPGPSAPAVKKVNMNGIADKVARPPAKGVPSGGNTAGKVKISKESRPMAKK